ncbi:MAG TPA: S9 family peptidase [Acidimicrobiales bacterium]|nr:S9 family peptidase [Acidimicrobiales bacterium]
MTVAPYGSWRSPITSAQLVEAVVGLAYPLVDGQDIAWTESRPTEGGRQVLVRRTADGVVRDVLPEGFSARTLVHEYGGLCTALAGESALFCNFGDQRVWRVDGDGPPVPVTPEPAVPMGDRYADLCLSRDGAWVVAVRERHPGGDDEDATQVVNDVVAFPSDGSSPPRQLVAGHDFFSAPRLSRDGRRLAWLAWDHPNMPWDGTELFVADVGADLTLGPPSLVAGGPSESISQPRWAPDGTLCFLSDRTGWWNLYAADGAGGRPLCPYEAEFGGPDWAFGQASYTFLGDGRLVAAVHDQGRQRLGLVDQGRLVEVGTEYDFFGGLVPQGDAVVAVVGSATRPSALARIELGPEERAGRVEVLKAGRETVPDRRYLSAPRPIEFPTGEGLTAHALFYPPANADFEGPPDERPPLVVMSHGGPTGATSPVLNLSIQYFTSRGLAVVDVNYGGSTGYGRPYRQRLQGRWGIVDVDDCANAARWLADRGEVDGDRMAIRGGSAGGYTTLAALTFRDVFAVGASHYGVADAAALAMHTHKFESRYLDGLIGPWPEARSIYEERSPIHHTDRLSCPLILFQGNEDRVVPPEQAVMMADALRAKGIPFALMMFDGEQHGFRRAETITRVMESELAFYGRVLGFRPADEIDPVPIEHEEALPAPVG